MFSLVACQYNGTAQEAPKNVIIMIADGFGPTSVTMARAYAKEYGTYPLALDEILVGTTTTHASNGRVTDSAASATAYATGHKTYNGAIAVDDNRQPLATVLEAATERGMATGLVATSRITHATPAAFAAHVPARGMEAEIAVQELAHNVDVILGGGARFFLPEAEGGSRGDGRNLFEEAAQNGMTVVRDRAGFDALATTPALGIFSSSHMDYDIDRDPAEQPSIAEMTQKAIDLLSRDADGFLLVIEGSRIDHAGHANDAAGHLHDILAYDAAVRIALDFAKENGETLLISTADHETGGMTLGRDGQYMWKPEVLNQVNASLGEALGQGIAEGLTLVQITEQYGGVTDLTDEERAAMEEAYQNRDQEQGVRLYLDAINTRAGIGWTTGGHTAVDVNVYAFGPSADLFRGAQDNTDIGISIATALGFDLAALTERLRANQ